MGHDHIRSVLMVAFFFSTCLIASFGSGMEIIRFSGTYTLTHSERVVQVTESITGSERVRKVTKVASLAPNEKRRRHSKRKRRTTKEFQMRQRSNSCNRIERKEKTFTPAASAMTLGTTADQQDLCWSHAHSHHPDSSIRGGQCSNNHESSQEFTAIYPDSVSYTSFLACQKVPFLQRNLSEWSIEGKGRSELVVAEEKKGKQQQYRNERQNIPLNDDDSPYKPIFFVYPPQRLARLGRKRKVGNDDGMDYYQPTFHLGFASIYSDSRSTSKDIDSWDNIFSEYDPRIRGGFDTYGEDVSFYFSTKTSNSHSAGFEDKSELVRHTGKEKGRGSANVSSYFDELCKALLLEYG